MKKTFLRSLIVMLSLSVILGLMACDNGGNSDEGKVIAEQYRGTFQIINNDDRPYTAKEIVFTKNTQISYRNNLTSDEMTAWTVGNQLYVKIQEQEVAQGTFTDNNTYQNYIRTK